MVLNDLDRIIIIIVGIGACIGLYRGFFREAIGIAGIVLAAIAANLASPFTKPYASSFIESDTIASIVVWVIVF
ncbi:MAG: CvpA family protein, partial [Bacteroidales bacterium]|nr:CvpA family protein [Bacteroidales bacterium]